ncbi:MAG: tRNA (N(6)-L-threonylcarbamoyladenosine(37)-C(2))-methylthiotransferase MtaB, partial [Pseudomonadota bacterium]|nr:tRNA (N(6)-L-threonylcarbamoyladenosine(37)-C(2))-methylthiotransferase MtaB [Pseudomonadota bacterium]
PTETEDHHAANLSIVRELGIVHGHIFPYSPRPGTPAARMPQVNGKAIKSRAARLRAAGETQVQTHLAAQIGRSCEILIETPRLGRTEQFTEVHFDTDLPEGQIIRAEITGRTESHLLGLPLHLG